MLLPAQILLLPRLALLILFDKYLPAKQRTTKTCFLRMELVLLLFIYKEFCLRIFFRVEFCATKNIIFPSRLGCCHNEAALGIRDCLFRKFNGCPFSQQSADENALKVIAI